MEALRRHSLEIGSAGKAMAGEKESGDRFLAKEFRDGALLAVVDGLGHGLDAAGAADRAIAVLESQPRDSVIALFRKCHDELRGTRGVVMSVASFSLREETVSWLSVGNVASFLFRADGKALPSCESPVMRNGVVGVNLPALLAGVTTIEPGDTLILATDGIGNGFIQNLALVSGPQRIADHILAGFGKSSDDALVLVARYRRGDR